MNRLWGLLLFLALPQSRPEKTVGYGNLLVRIPESWKYEYKEEGLFLRPGDLKEEEALVVILSLGRKAEGSLAEGSEKVWKQSVGTRKLLNRAPERELKTHGGVDGLLSVGLIDLGDGDRLILTVAAFKPGDRIEAVVAMTAQQRVFERYSEAVRALLKNLRFRNVELPVAYELLLASEPGAAPSFRCRFADGSLLAELPPEGMEGFDLQEARTRFEKSWGSHEKKGAGWLLRLGGREETLAIREGGRVVLIDAQGKESRCTPVDPSTGLKLEGRYVVVGRPDPPVMEFKADGTFTDPGGVVRAGAGSYGIVRNTITLTGPEGRPKSVLFAAVREFILIGGTWLKRS